MDTCCGLSERKGNSGTFWSNVVVILKSLSLFFLNAFGDWTIKTNIFLYKALNRRFFASLQKTTVSFFLSASSPPFLYQVLPNTLYSCVYAQVLSVRFINYTNSVYFVKMWQILYFFIGITGKLHNIKRYFWLVFGDISCLIQLNYAIYL